MKSLNTFMIFLVIFTFQIFAQNKPFTKSSSDSLHNDYLQKLYDSKIEINDIGVIKAPVARITDDIEMMSSSTIKLVRNDTVTVKYYFPTIKVCYINFNNVNGYMDVEKLDCKKIFKYRDSIQNEIDMNKLKRIEEWEAKKLLVEIEFDSLKKIEEKEFIKEMTKKYGKKWGKIVGEKKIMIGMTKEMVIDSWGEPDDINRSVGSWGVHEQWVYGLGQYLYFENGKLTSWQD